MNAQLLPSGGCLPPTRAQRPRVCRSSWLILGAAILMALGPAIQAATVLARGKGVEVTQEHLDEAFVNLRATLATQGRSVAEQQRPTVERQLVEKLALTQLLLAKSTEDDRKRAGEKVAKLIENQKAMAKSDARFEAQIRAAGMSPETFQKQLEERAVCEEVLDRELRPLLGVTDEKVRSYYDQNANEFRRPERVRLMQIVLSTRAPSGAELSETEREEKKLLAEKLSDRLKKGEDLAALAREFSDDPVGRDRGGEYVFPVNRMVPELETAIAKMPTNQVSGVIATPYALHLVKVVERLPGELTPFEEVRESIKARLELEATQAQLPDYQKKLFEEAKVEFPKKP
ncbi:MAG: peptidyl-prolyl cis-trans isomerase [Verrucomicrobiales bacterium]|nr:peptidyl-prolyl cis-trans isomerase [Verrucomicrobiales bacterium]